MNKNNGLLLKNFNLDCSERKIKLKDRGLTNWMYTGHWYDYYECFMLSIPFIPFKLYKT